MNTPIIVHMDIFSVGLDELTRKQQRDIRAVLAVLKKHGRFSVFEATENNTIATTMDTICDNDLIEIDSSMGYPWSKCKLTPEGERVLTGGSFTPKKKPIEYWPCVCATRDSEGVLIAVKTHHPRIRICKECKTRKPKA